MHLFYYKLKLLLISIIFFSFSSFAATEITIASITADDMKRLKGYSDVFEKANPDIKLNFLVLGDTELLDRVTADITGQGGQFDVVFLSPFQVQNWGNDDLLLPVDDAPSSYNYDDLLPAVRSGLTIDGQMLAVPFYGETSFTFYRKDLFEAAGLTMPEKPTWDQMYKFAEALHDPDDEVYGMCMRGAAHWGLNLNILATIANGYGGSWFDMDWNPQFTSEPWKIATNLYVDILNKYGPPGATTIGVTENITLVNTGRCAMWVDATVLAGNVTNPENSQVHDKLGFARAPCGTTCQGSGWAWTWAMGIPKTSNKVEAAKKYIYWATSKEYNDMVKEKDGQKYVLPGTRTSTYTQEYIDSAEFVKLTLDGINDADITNPSINEVPYVGISFLFMPDFQGFAGRIANEISAAQVGDKTVEEALEAAQQIALDSVTKSGLRK
jgi:sorbitol/mannitol transport system substrate-binding protein|tara:strand:- start:1035 stop:2351 length:1317 start_codon:yes stop_codon:yes gene_type:complete